MQRLTPANTQFLLYDLFFHLKEFQDYECVHPILYRISFKIFFQYKQLTHSILSYYSWKYDNEVY